MRKPENVVAVGEVNGAHVQIIGVTNEYGMDYIWRVLRDGKVIGMSEQNWTSIKDAFDAAVAFLIPDAVPVEMPKASEKDLDALNALLYVGGLQEDITSAEEALMFKATFEHALDAVRAVREQAPKDLDVGRLIIASTHGVFHKAALDISKISSVFEAQCTVFEMILERSIETIDAFLTGYGQ